MPPETPTGGARIQDKTRRSSLRCLIMMNFRKRQTLIVLGDRILLLTRDRWRGRLSLVQTGQVLDGQTDSKKLVRLAESALPDGLEKGDTDIVLGTPWTRTELITLPGSSLSSKEEFSVAETCSKRMGGEFSTPPEPLLVRFARLPGKLLVAATAGTTGQHLVESLGRRKVRVRSLQPLFSWISTHPQTRPRQQEGWSALHEPGALSVCHYTAGELDSYQSHPVGNGSADLSGLVRRQVAATGWPEGEVEFLSIGTSLVPLPTAWKVATLPYPQKQ